MLPTGRRLEDTSFWCSQQNCWLTEYQYDGRPHGKLRSVNTERVRRTVPRTSITVFSPAGRALLVSSVNPVETIIGNGQHTSAAASQHNVDDAVSPDAVLRRAIVLSKNFDLVAPLEELEQRETTQTRSLPETNSSEPRRRPGANTVVAA